LFEIVFNNLTLLSPHLAALYGIVYVCSTIEIPTTVTVQTKTPFKKAHTPKAAPTNRKKLLIPFKGPYFLIKTSVVPPSVVPMGVIG
jgi:hypothetical protein